MFNPHSSWLPCLSNSHMTLPTILCRYKDQSQEIVLRPGQCECCDAALRCLALRQHNVCVPRRMSADVWQSMPLSTPPLNLPQASCASRSWLPPNEVGCPASGPGLCQRRCHFPCPSLPALAWSQPAPAACHGNRPSHTLVHMCPAPPQADLRGSWPKETLPAASQPGCPFRRAPAQSCRVTPATSPAACLGSQGTSATAPSSEWLPLLWLSQSCQVMVVTRLCSSTACLPRRLPCPCSGNPPQGGAAGMHPAGHAPAAGGQLHPGQPLRGLDLEGPVLEGEPGSWRPAWQGGR